MAIFSAIAAIATAIGGLASTFFAGGIGAFLLRTAVGIGINFLSSALADQPEQPKFSINGKLQAGDDQARAFPLGKSCTAGTLVYANTWGESGDTPNAYLTQVIALSDMPGCELRELFVNGEKVTIDYSDTSYEMGFPIKEYNDEEAPKKNNHLWIKFYDGTQTTADSFLVNKVSSSDRPYGSTRVGKGICYAILTSQVEEELFTGFPSFKFELSGIALYDPSKDTSVGGNGTQRYDTPSTWQPSENPAVQIYNLLRGISYDGKWLYGVQNMPAARLPVDHWIAQIQKCNAQIQGPDGLEPIYRSGGFISVDAPVADAINAIQTACAGRLAEIGGTYKFPLGEPSSTANWSFSDGDILSTEEQSFTPFFGLADSINGVTAKYPSPDEAWNTKVAPPLYNPDYEAQDGNRRLISDVELNFVPYPAQVQRLMKSSLAEARRARRHTFVLPPDYWGIEPGDIIAWSSERNGYESKLFRVDGVADKANLDVTVDLTEVDPSDYDWDQATDYRAPVNGTINQVRPPAQELTGWQVAPAIFYDSDGDARRPSIQVSYAGGQLDVDGIRVQVRLASSGVVVFDAEMAYDAPEDQQYSVILNGTFLPNANYEARGIYTSISGRPFTWSAWLAVTTPDVRIGGADLYPISLGELADDVKGYQNWIGQSVREIIQQLEAVALKAADQDLGNFSDKQTLRRELVSTRDDITAKYTEAIVAATGPGSALVARIEDLEVYVDDTVATAIDSLTTEINQNGEDIDALSASLQSLSVTVGTKASADSVSALSSRVTTNEGNITANADAIQSLSVTVDDVASSVTVRGTAQASPGDGWARWGVEVKTGAGDDWSTAAFYLDAKLGLSRAVFVADQFIITDGTNNAAPFVFTGGVATMENARIGTVTFNQLSSANGKLVLKGSGANASIEVFT